MLKSLPNRLVKFLSIQSTAREQYGFSGARILPNLLLQAKNVGKIPRYRRTLTDTSLAGSWGNQNDDEIIGDITMEDDQQLLNEHRRTWKNFMALLQWSCILIFMTLLGMWVFLV